MNIQEAKTEICNTLRAYLAKDENGYYTYPLIRQRPLLLIGPPGIGKTAIMEQAAAECGVGLVAYTAQAKNITVYDTDGNIFYDLGYDGLYSDDVSRILSRLEEENQDVWAYAHTYRNRDILILGRRIYEQYSQSRVIGYTLISIDEKIFSKTVLEPVGLADSSNIMYLNMDGTILSSWDRSIQLGQKTEKKLLKNIQARLPNRTDFFSIYKDGEEQLVTYIFNKNLNQLFVYTMPYHYINSEVNAML